MNNFVVRQKQRRARSTDLQHTVQDKSMKYHVNDGLKLTKIFNLFYSANQCWLTFFSCDVSP